MKNYLKANFVRIKASKITEPVEYLCPKLSGIGILKSISNDFWQKNNTSTTFKDEGGATRLFADEKSGRGRKD